MNLQVLYEDESILVCYKPAKVATQTGRMGAMDMESMVKNYLYRKPENKGKGVPYVAVVHRLDQPVEGVLVKTL